MGRDRSRLQQAFLALSMIVGTGCASVPEPKMKPYLFPSETVFVDKPKKPYTVSGRVRARVDFPSLDQKNDEKTLCKNYYNKAANEIWKRAQKADADAVVELRSVVYLLDGRTEMHKTPECSDDGDEGQILLEGWAVKWVPTDGNH